VRTPICPVRNSRLVDPIIRPYHETDALDVVRLSLRAWTPVFASERDVMGDEIFERLNGDDWRRQQRQDVEKVLADGETEVWVAEVNGRVVGFVAAVLKVDGRMGEVYMLAVDPESQNHGLGTQLTDVATDWIRNAGLSLALVSTGGDAGHAAARRTYEKAGYTPVPSVNYFKAL
jgi:ribosomal protein S18 acetylase RimI-like enzyme